MIITKFNETKEEMSSLTFYLAAAIITGLTFILVLVFLLIKKCGDRDFEQGTGQSETSTESSSASSSSSDLPSYSSITISTMPPSYAQATAGEIPPEYHNYALPM